jgi:type IV secretory pathway TrbL component
MRWLIDTNRVLIVVLVAVVAGDAAASAQGTKDRASGTQTGSASRSGISTSSHPDSMGGAFKGTGMPTYGTSPGMGSPKKPRP